MTTFRAWVMAASVAAMCVPAAALANFSGNYLLTVTAAKPDSFKGTQVCAVLVDDGSVLGWMNSGTITINGLTGQFIVVRHQLLGWIVSGSGTNVYTAKLPQGGTNITGSGIAELDPSGSASATGAYSATNVASC
jgi:hypothetical protein